MRHQTPTDCIRPLKTLDAPGFTVREAVYCAAISLAAERDRWVGLCLTLGGAYRIERGRTRLSCGPASLVLQAPGETYRVQVSEVGSHCLTVAIDPSVVGTTAGTLDFGRLNGMRRPPPHWLAFQLWSKLEFGDDLSCTSVANILIELLAELGDRPGLEMRDVTPSWLARVQEHIHDEFRLPHTLESLAQEAGVHHVHLAREFRRRFGCTVGHYIRQRRVEFSCHRLTASLDPLTEIAFDAGFADQSHFTNTFRRLVGIAPRTHWPTRNSSVQPP